MSERGAPAWLDALVLVARLVVGGIFVYAAASKVGDPAGFAQAVHNYRLVPLPLLHAFALFLPGLELLAGLGLLLGLAPRGAALICLGMSIMFTFAVGSALARDLDISCGCFHTEGGADVGTSLLIRDLLLLAGCALLLVWHRSAGHGWRLLRRRV
jgi:uncharacterized membrane protein YphA (DoxX/SURF4 family)